MGKESSLRLPGGCGELEYIPSMKLPESDQQPMFEAFTSRRKLWTEFLTKLPLGLPNDFDQGKLAEGIMTELTEQTHWYIFMSDGLSSGCYLYLSQPELMELLQDMNQPTDLSQPINLQLSRSEMLQLVVSLVDKLNKSDHPDKQLFLDNYQTVRQYLIDHEAELETFIYGAPAAMTSAITSQMLISSQFFQTHTFFHEVTHRWILALVQSGTGVSRPEHTSEEAIAELMGLCLMLSFYERNQPDQLSQAQRFIQLWLRTKLIKDEGDAKEFLTKLIAASSELRAEFKLPARLGSTPDADNQAYQYYFRGVFASDTFAQLCQLVGLRPELDHLPQVKMVVVKLKEFLTANK